MSFQLEKVVPWGRNMDEYLNMFHLTKEDMQKRIISFGDGPASFNAQMTKAGNEVLSVDLIYQFTASEIQRRIVETTEIVIEQLENNQDDFVWKNIKDVADLRRIRLETMSRFIGDFDLGKEQERYLFHELPAQTKYGDHEFDLGLSSHFLILYSQLGLDFHIESIKEMLRICKEIRIFPLLNLESKPSEVLDGIIQYFKKDYSVAIKTVAYEFQKGGNQMLVIN